MGLFKNLKEKAHNFKAHVELGGFEDKASLVHDVLRADNVDTFTKIKVACRARPYIPKIH